MVTAEIRGKKFPLCLTVAALDQINAKCGGLNGLSDFLRGNGNGSRAMVNTAWMLGLLIAEGEENRLVEARFAGAPAERVAVPDAATISHLLTYKEARSYYNLVWEAVAEGVYQDIEAEYPKNVPNAGQG